MGKIKKLYYSIGEVSEITGLKQYVLRYWETEFTQLRPSKNSAGNRTYKQKDLDFINEIKSLLYDQKFTIKGALKHLKNKSQNNKNGKSSVLNLTDDSLNDLQKTINELQQNINKFKEIIK